MLQYSFHEIDNTELYGVLSILDYETPVRTIIEQITFPLSDKRRSIVVDLALKSGMNQYRFLLLDVSFSGGVVWRSNAYYKASPYVENKANSFLREQAEIVSNSVLSDKMVKKILERK